MHDGNKTILACTAIGVAGALVTINDVLKQRRLGREKRAKIKAWEQEVIGAVYTVRDDVMRNLADPTKDHNESMRQFMLDQKFLGIIANNPPT